MSDGGNNEHFGLYLMTAAIICLVVVLLYDTTMIRRALQGHDQIQVQCK